MADPKPPAFVELLDKAKQELVDLQLLLLGVKDAQAEIARQAALTLANGMYPVSFFAMLGKLQRLREEIESAQAAGVTQAVVEHT